MRQRFPQLGVGTLCGLFGKSRNAYYEHVHHSTSQALLDGLVLEQVAQLRAELPQLGTRKLHFLLGARLGASAKLSRDHLFTLLAAHGLLIRRRPRRVVTTQACLPRQRRPNLIEHLLIERPEQVWVSDITYVRLAYLSLITDLYSRKIVGFCLHPDLSVRGTLAALQQALVSRTQPRAALIHHSDRGLQYAAREYVGLLEAHGVAISMTQHGSPYENAVAERVNGILKHEFGLADPLPGFAEAAAQVARAVQAYNELRPHSSCDYLTPCQAHERVGLLPRRWKQAPARALSPEEVPLELPPAVPP